MVSLALATTRDDPCDFATPNFVLDQIKYYATPSEALACFRSIPFPTLFTPRKKGLVLKAVA